MKARLAYFLNESGRGAWVLTGLILVSIAPVVIGTEFSDSALIQWVLFAIGLVFLVEYLLRIWVAPLTYQDAERPRLKYMTSFNGMIDAAASLPVLLGPVLQGSAALRALRLLRMVQLLKIRRVREAVRDVTSALSESWDELLFTLVLAFVLILMGATAMYFAEGDIDPENFGSIPRCMWWSMATLTTVGYGDVYPTTAAGKLIASMIALVGIAAVALPAGILASAFSDTRRKRKEAG